MGSHQDMFSLAGKVALVTGGGGGLGRMFCQVLAEYGAAVALADIDERGAAETAESARDRGGRVLPITADVSSPDDVARMVETAAAHFGRIDILVNNAGVSPRPARVAETSIEDWDRVMGIDLRGVFLCARACLPLMASRRGGNVINIASILGVRPFPGFGDGKANFPYGVAKAGVIRLTKDIAADYAADGIRANCIAPGWHTGTRLSGRWNDADDATDERRRYIEAVAARIPMGRWGEASELAGLLVYLASDASSYMTGQVLVSDGGACL
ncbi:MAG: SDR family NAD(P)-dependent oxidoreductase [Thermoleophilia bacterium]